MPDPATRPQRRPVLIVPRAAAAVLRRGLLKGHGAALGGAKPAS